MRGTAMTTHERALIVVDMQNGFCHPQGSVPVAGMALADVDRAVANNALVVADARRNGVPVIFTRHVYRPGRSDEGSNLGRMQPALADLGGLAEGSWDGDVIDELSAGPEDLYVDKARFDAFQWTSLDLILQGMGVRELVVTGVVTNICVESTVRSGFMRDYPITVLGDCCAAMTTRLHDIGLEVLESYRLATVASVADGFTFAVASTETLPAAELVA